MEIIVVVFIISKKRSILKKFRGRKKLKKIFFVTYGGVHANIVKLVAPKLSSENQVSILALTLAPKVLDKGNLPYKKIKDYLCIFSKEETEKILSFGKELAQIEYNPNSGIEFEECVAYLGLGYWNLVQDLGSQEAKIQFIKLGRKAFCPVDVMTKILQYEKPDVVVVTADVRVERASGIAANRLEIPVVHIQDLPEMDKLTYKAYVCVMNQYAKNYILEHKAVSEEMLYITGQPVIESNTVVDHNEMKKMQKNFCFEKYKKIIVYLEQPLNLDIPEIEEFLLQESFRHPDYLYIIKLHPNQDFDKPMEFNLDCNYRKIRDCNLKVLLSFTDLAITRDSNSGLEAAMMGVPLIVVGLKEPVRVDFSKYGIAKKVNSIQEMKLIMECICKEDQDLLNSMEIAREQFLNKSNAASNIAEIIRKAAI